MMVIIPSVVTPALVSTLLVLVTRRVTHSQKKVPGFKPPRCNNTVKMECAKVVDTIDVEDMGDKGVFCRCWKSKKFPFCDGSHVKHNAETGDNTGPLIIKKSA